LSAGAERRVAGRVGRPHGLDGSFHVDGVAGDLAEGTEVSVAGRSAVVERRAGTADRPLVRVSGVGDRDAAAALRGEPLLVVEAEGPAAEGEYEAAQIVGCTIEGLGEVRRVVPAPSCDVLEVGPDGFLVPFVSDAIRRVDTDARVIEVDRRFLGLEEGGADPVAQPDEPREPTRRPDEPREPAGRPDETREPAGRPDQLREPTGGPGA
jgi:16S rRNA processing protein RimM